MSSVRPGIIAKASRTNPLVRSEAVVLPPTEVGDAPDVQAVTIANVGVVTPYNLLRDTSFVQAVGVPTTVSVPQGVYGVRVGDVQLAAQARTVKHRPNGNASVLRVEGVWPSALTGAQTISLTALPPDVTPAVTIQRNGGDLEVLIDGEVEYTITPVADAVSISGDKTANLKGSNTSPSYVPSTSFHEWHITNLSSGSSVTSGFDSLVVEEDTSILTCYLARGSDTNYEIQMRLIVYKYRPWVRWEYTTFKHFPVNLPGQTGSMSAIRREALQITPKDDFTEGTVKTTTSSSGVAVLGSPDDGAVTGSVTGSYTDSTLNAVFADGTYPLTVGVKDLMAMGPSALAVSTTVGLANVLINFWSPHSDECLDFRGTGKAGEVQADSSDYNASPRGNAKTWEGFFTFGNDLALAQQFAAWDDLWMMTPTALELSQAYGPLKAAAVTEFSAWWKRITAIQRISEASAERNDFVGYGLYGLFPHVIPRAVDTTVDRYVAEEPMHSGRYGPTDDSHTNMGYIITALLMGDRAKFIRALRRTYFNADMDGCHSLFGGADGSQYMGSGQDGVHRRYRDSWTGRVNDQQYYYVVPYYGAYWFGGWRRMIERGEAMTDTFLWRGSQPYPTGPWALACRYMYTHDAGDLADFNAEMSATISLSNASFTPPASLAGKPASILWNNFRYGHNTCPMLIDAYEATGNQSILDELALAYRLMDFSPSGSSWDIGMSAYGNRVTAFHAAAYLRLRGYSESQVSSNVMNSMQHHVGQYMPGGTLVFHNASLPSGDPELYTWSQAVSYLNQVAEMPPEYEITFGPMIASWYSTQN